MITLVNIERELLDKRYLITDNDNYLVSEKNASKSIAFISESSRDCHARTTYWRKDGAHIIDNHNNALAVKDLPQKG